MTASRDGQAAAAEAVAAAGCCATAVKEAGPNLAHAGEAAEPQPPDLEAILAEIEQEW